MRRFEMAALVAALALVAAACGEGEVAEDTTTTAPEATTTAPEEPAETTAPPGEPAETTTTTEAEEAAGVAAAETELGTVLVGPDGMTLYIFTVDGEGVSECYDGCAVTWPPLPADTPISGDLDAAIFGSAPRDDGPDQLTVNDMPLYYYAGDSAPGDVEGQGFNGVWFVVDADGNPLDNPGSSGGGYGYTP